jgi:hypothetical protein
MSFLNITLVKRQIRKSEDETDQDAELQDIVNTAEEHVFNLINRYPSGYTATTLPLPLKRAILYVAANQNEFRESLSRGTVSVVPDTLYSLIYPYINYADKF